MTRVDPQKVLLAFQDKGCTLLSPYEKSSKKLEYVCPKGHCHSILWSNFQKGVNCGYCAKKLVTNDQVKQAFEKEGYTLLSVFEKSNQKLEFICHAGHRHSIKWNSFQQGSRCAYCTGLLFSRDKVKEAFELEGYQLLGEYERWDKKLNFICPNGHSHSITWGNFKKGQRCSICRKTCSGEVLKAFADAGYKLLDTYKTSGQKLKFICPKGHCHSISWGDFKRGNRCVYCNRPPVTIEEVEKSFLEAGYCLTTKSYINNRTLLDFICDKGHSAQITWHGFSRGNRCNKCRGGKKTEEEKHFAMLHKRLSKQIYNAIRSRKKILKIESSTKFAYSIAQPVFEKLGRPPLSYDLDHLVPASFFDFSKIEELHACWNPANLRYVPRRENHKRGNRLTLEEVETFTQEQIAILKIASKKPKKWETYLLNNAILFQPCHKRGLERIQLHI